MKVIVSNRRATVITKTPEKLLATIKTRMSQKEPSGKIKTWECDTDGDFRYLAQQYDGVAWVRPMVVDGAIDLKLVWPDGAEPPQEIKAIFLCRFSEMVVGHFGQEDFIETKTFALVV